MGILDRIFGKIIMTQEDADALFNKGTKLGQSGKYQEAIACFDKVIEINPRDAESWTNKGFLLGKLQKYREGMECCDKALEINPQFLMAWSNKGATLHALNKYQGATECYEKALEIDPKDAISWFNKGVALASLNKLEEAIISYNEALEINPRFIEAMKSKGYALFDLGNLRESIVWYDRILEINPKNTLIRDIKEKVKRKLGETGHSPSAEGKIKQKDVEELIELLKNNNYHVEVEAAEALGRIRSERAAEALIQTFNNEYSLIRDKAIRALGKIGGEKAIETLILALKDESPNIRAEAAEALGKIGNKTAILPLSQVLQDENQYVQQTVALALEKLKDNGSKETVIKVRRENEETGYIKSGEESATEKSYQPKFIRNERKGGIGGDATYEIYQGNDAESARAFLLTKRIDKKLYYIIIETPEGNWGMDVEGLFLEQLLPWQANINSANCEGSIIPMSWSMLGLGSAARGQNDNFIAKVQCGKCEHQWRDGIRYQDFTVVRCPKCKTLNTVDSNNIEVWQV